MYMAFQTPMKSAMAKKFIETEFVRSAVADRADLSAFKKRPSLKTIAGIFAIGFSYLIGWPAVGALGTLSIYLREPLIAIIGGPVTYGLSHLVFLLGMYLAGADYTKMFLRWVARVAAEKYLDVPDRPISDQG